MEAILLLLLKLRINMPQRKDILVFVAVCLILGILVVWQFFASKEAAKLTTEEENQLLALEVSRLIKANTDLRLEIQDLASTSEKYEKSLVDRQSAIEEVGKNLQKYQILAGVTKIQGPGVEIKIDGDLDQTQIVDLINALRNIGVEGISINGKRIIISSSFSTRADGLYLNTIKLDNPYTILAVGDGPLIEEALNRRGGIIEQLETSSKDIKVIVDKKDQIVLDKI